MNRLRLPFAILAVSITVTAALGVTIVTDTIRLGPSSYDLSPNAMYLTVNVRWLNRSANTTLLDFYSLVVTIRNNVVNNTIRPYELDVAIPLPNGGFMSWWPDNPYFAANQEQVTLEDGELLLMPAGQILIYMNPVNVGQGTSTMRWLVLGESSSGSVSVMDDHAQFYLEAVLPKNQVLHSNATATLTWDYRGSIQTYPVASRTMTVDFVMRSDLAST